MYKSYLTDGQYKAMIPNSNPILLVSILLMILYLTPYVLEMSRDLNNSYWGRQTKSLTSFSLRQHRVHVSLI